MYVVLNLQHDVTTVVRVYLVLIFADECREDSDC